MRILWLLALMPCSCAGTGANAGAPREIVLPGVPPLAAPDPARTPAPGSLGRDAALADRFSAGGQQTSYAFEARAGELSLFSLETWGYDRGWHARAQVDVLDEQGRSYDAREIESGMAGFHLAAFVAPRDGSYRYRIRLLEGWFRYRLARRSGYRPQLRGALEELGRAEHVAGYLADGDDERRYRVNLARGERVDIALRHAEPQARSEQRRSGPNRLHPVLELALEGADAQPQPGGGAYLVLPRGAERSCVVRVRTRAAGGGARFDLALARQPRVFLVEGTVVDREDRPLAGVELAFLRGSDRDCTARATTDGHGRYAAELPPGAYRVRMGHWGQPSPHGADCTIDAARTLDLVWLDEPLTRADREESAAQ